MIVFFLKQQSINKFLIYKNQELDKEFTGYWIHYSKKTPKD